MNRDYRNILFYSTIICLLIQGSNVQIVLAEGNENDWYKSTDSSYETGSDSSSQGERQQSGLRMVPNPERERLKQEIADLEDQIATHEDQIRRGVIPNSKNSIDFLWYLKNKLADLQAQYANARQYVVEQ